MKKWNEPKVVMLGIEETYDTTHYCHKSGSEYCGENKDDVDNNNTSNHAKKNDKKDHYWTGLMCPTHEQGENDKGKGESACCCFTS
ncbi:MAG: hypothetical protein RR128_08115 [Clostridium sp.]